MRPRLTPGAACCRLPSRGRRQATKLVNRRQLKAWKAVSRKVFLGSRSKMVGKAHATEPSLRKTRQTWKRNLKKVPDEP